MKILIIQDTDWIRRNPIQHTHLTERLAQRGHEIRVIDYEILWKKEGKQELLSERCTQSVSRIIPNSNILVIRPPILKIPVLDYVSMLFTYNYEIKTQIRDFQPDLIWGNDILTTCIAFKTGLKNKIPCLFYSIDIDYRLVPYRFLQPLGKWIESWNIKHADFVLSINEGLREYTIRMGARKEKTRVIRAGIDLEKFDPSKVNGDEIRKQYGIKNDDIVLFFMGWLYHFSGLKEVARKMAEIKDQYPQFKLLIVGEGDAYEELQSIRTQFHLEERMFFTGQQPFDNLPALIASSDICLLPAFDNEIMHDIVPIKMYEYMAMGKPIVSTRLYGVMKEFGDGNGIRYADSPEKVIDVVITLMDFDTIKEQGKKSRNFVKNFNWNNIVNDFEMKLKEIVENHS